MSSFYIMGVRKTENLQEEYTIEDIDNDEKLKIVKMAYAEDWEKEIGRQAKYRHFSASPSDLTLERYGQKVLSGCLSYPYTVWKYELADGRHVEVSEEQLKRYRREVVEDVLVYEEGERYEFYYGLDLLYALRDKLLSKKDLSLIITEQLADMEDDDYSAGRELLPLMRCYFDDFENHVIYRD